MSCIDETCLQLTIPLLWLGRFRMGCREATPFRISVARGRGLGSSLNPVAPAWTQQQAFVAKKGLRRTLKLGAR